MPVRPIARLELAFAPRPWRFAAERRAEIAAHFDRLRRDKPALYNGPVLLMHAREVAGDVLRGAYLQTDFASFIAWRDWGFPDPDATNCFALGALRGSDGGYLLGVMGGHTMNAGRIYFPGGMPDPADIVAGAHVDLEGSVRREVWEETGLDPAHFDPAPGWVAVLAGPRIALVKLLQAHEPADVLRQRIRRHLEAEQQPELADIHIVREPDDLNPCMPPFVLAYFAHLRGLGGPAAAAGKSAE
ncbi:MAG: NUDIX hydrolase [Variibacter sp.]|nr:NUDIX hydrolase [Variibacter sp.]